MDKFKVNVVSIPVKDLESNTGQIKGLPKNPRFIKDERFKKLVKSIKDDPELLILNELKVIKRGNKYVVLGGNMRLKAITELKHKTALCKVIPPATSVKKMKAIVIKDNVSFGEDDLGLWKSEWDTKELIDFGVEMPSIPVNLDYSLLSSDEVESRLEQMKGGVKKAIMIEFEKEDYEPAFALVKKCKEKNLYIGKILMDVLKKTKL